MTFEEWVGKYKAVEAGTTVALAEPKLARKAQVMGWLGDGDPHGDEGHRIHEGLFSCNPDVRTIKGFFWPTEPLAVAVFNRQVVAFDYQGLMWCRFDHRKKGLASACLNKRGELYANYMTHARARISFQEKRPDRITPGGLASMRRRYDRLVETGVITP